MMRFTSVIRRSKFAFVALVLVIVAVLGPKVLAATESGSIGIEGAVPGEPPKTAATIAFPRSGSSFTSLPITVTGICPDGTTVRIYKNNVFSGSAECINGSYSIKIDLFAGRNELVAKVYDELGQKGPDSETVVVNFPNSSTGDSSASRISLTSSFAKRGANPGQTLTWPMTLSGGEGPYAITVDWGDGTDPDISSQQFPGVFDAKHAYEVAGTYAVVVRASDKNNNLAFLQVVGVANGPLEDNNQQAEAAKDQGETKVLWLPALAAIPLILAAFWLGKRHEIQALRKRLGRR